MKTYYNKKLNLYYTEGSILKIGNNTTFNPSPNFLKRNGFEEVVNEETDVTNKIKRACAYATEIDQYIITYMGYILEGKTDLAEIEKEKYISRKHEIRSVYPDND